ncbi:CDP-diacylglycerol--glycerol-3-phosphate 3-phosphatidyltransferase [Orenia metallireducens]|uniref:CDP-diacylglycerol--glycerol-3-phosphate 3-phosphatidyltransferase n=1 Tax=Orenia metallireducens TaxID=1413210 RepID=A0A285GWP0_9FIRM|nr:CDP-diacylglycerol--glycerol-3-phosphate 3-phosphatidyltransferase [Orenia metallireducens]PRX31051.1 CDP-diacylglycerol--glycerol-3-phosphate 3-phosphatidyltransferase [Orenia metallireducens]SNY27895.1 CDP-diacylglycerol--glycerol-3-phosphate 3-phosphatidyltransferase [Orenia metallireducens]
MNLNLPNKLSLLRIALVPIFMVFLLVESLGDIGRYLALGFFILAAITDALDGYIARRDGLVTNLGKFIDPLADKLLVSAAFISLVDMQAISAWPAVIIISREFAVTGLRILAAAEGVVIAASNLGKYKTNAQIFSIIFLILGLPFANILLWAAVILTLISGLDYLLKSKELISE